MTNLKTITEVVAKELDLYKKDVDAVLRKSFEVITEEMKNGEVRIPGFGTFSFVPVADMERRNPITGETFTSPAHMKPKFKAAINLKEIGKEMKPEA